MPGLQRDFQIILFTPHRHFTYCAGFKTTAQQKRKPKKLRKMNYLSLC